MKRKRKPRFDKCQMCAVDPNKKEYEGRQIYVCDKCQALVCSDCSEDGNSKQFGFNNPVVCQPCACELRELKAEQAGLR